MGRIDFSKLARQPKYALPIIVLPFVLLLGGVLVGTAEEDEKVEPSAAEVVVDLPDAVEQNELSKSELMEQRIREEEADRRAYNDSIAAVEQARKLDSIMKASQMSTRRQRESVRRVNDRSNRSSSQSSRSTSRSNNKPQEEELSEFEKFKAEMEMLDRLANPEKAVEEKPKITNPNKSKDPEPKTVTKASVEESEYFNTLRDKRQPSHIHAMVDEVVKGKQGSRVRIRLSDDIEVDGYKLTKGTYLYSFISGFGNMRVYLTINNIMVEDKIIPVKLEIYDLDANPGLYVPKSNFATIVQESGSQLTGSMRVNVDQSESSRLAELGYDMFDQLISIGTRTAGRNLSKNKARIKYNTQVILVNGNEKYGVMSAAEKMERGRVAVGELARYRAALEAGDQAAIDQITAKFDPSKPEGEEFLREYFAYFGYGYLDTPQQVVPNVPLLFYSFRVMVGAGCFFILLLGVIWWLNRKDKLADKRWLLRVAVWSIPLAYLASQAGWVLAEVGRQPWAIQDLMPVGIAASKIGPGSVSATFFIFLALFTALLIAELSIMFRQIKIGPENEKQ